MSSLEYLSPGEGTIGSDPVDIAAAFGVPLVRIDILRALRKAPATVSKLAATVGYTRYGVREHLDLLERIGAIRHDTQRVAGSFRPARLYRLDSAGVDALAWSIFEPISDGGVGDEG